MYLLEPGSNIRVPNHVAASNPGDRGCVTASYATRQEWGRVAIKLLKGVLCSLGLYPRCCSLNLLHEMMMSLWLQVNVKVAHLGELARNKWLGDRTATGDNYGA